MLLGGVLGGSWGILGVSMGSGRRLGMLLEGPGGVLGRPGGVLGGSLAILERVFEQSDFGLIC